MRKFFIVLASTTLLASLMSGCTAPQASTTSNASAAAPTSKKVSWDVPSFYKASMPGIGTNQGWIAEQLQTVSGGSINLNIAEPGKVIKSPKEILDAVSNGIVEAGYAASVFWQDRLKAAPLFTAVPFGPEAPEYLAWIYHGGGMELYQRMYDQAGYNVKVLVAGISAPETAGWFREEITDVSMLSGKSMRIAGLGGAVLQKLGMQTIQMPGGEIFPNLDTGKIDAAEYSTPAADASQQFYRKAKFNYFPGWHQQATLFELLINKDAWNSLSDAQRAQFETVCRAAVTDSLAHSEAIQGPAMQQNIEKNNVEVRYWSDAHLTAFKGAWEEVLADSCKDPFFNEVWTSLSSFRKEYALWSRHGFLPREGGN